MLKLLRFLKPHWKVAALSPLLMIIEVTADLWQPTLLASIVDVGVSQGDLGFIFRTGVLMVGVALVGVIGGVGCTITASTASQHFAADLRRALFAKVQMFSFANLDKFKTSSLITRLTNDVTQMQQLVLMSLRAMVRFPLLGLGGMVMAVRINPRLSLVLLVSIPVLIILMAVLIRIGFGLFSLLQKKLDKVNEVMRENLSGIRLIKAFVRADYEQDRFSKANLDLMDVAVRAGRLMALAMPLIMLIMNGSVVAILYFGGVQVTRGTMQVGEIMAFINYMLHILNALMMVAFLFILVSRAKVSGDRMQEVLAEEVDIGDVPDAINAVLDQGTVEFDRVSFSYPGAAGAPVLCDISFRVEAGETVAIIGGTGAGKSTLVSLLLRLYDPSEGTIFIDGHDISQVSLQRLRRSVSIVLQEAVLFSGTIKENIRWGRAHAQEEEVQQAAAVAQAHDFIMSFPEGYNSLLGQRAVNLSGGEKQRVSIARAVLKDAPILVLDDSTSAVDAGTESRLQRALAARSGKMTTFIVAQRIQSVMSADRILVLDEGRLVATGKHQELLADSELYREIYRSQMGEEAV